MSWAARKGTKTQYRTTLGLDCKPWHTHTQFNTHTHKLWQSNTGRMCVSQAAVKQGASEVGALRVFLETKYPASGWTHLQSHTQTHSHTQTQTHRKVSLTACSQAVNHWIRPFYERCTAEGWSLVAVSAYIPSWLTAAGQNTKAVSGKLRIKVHHLDCHRESAAGQHAASIRDRCERGKGQLWKKAQLKLSPNQLSPKNQLRVN